MVLTSAGAVRRVVLVVATIATIGSMLAVCLHAQTLRYDWKPTQKFSYDFEITVEGDDSTTSYKGITHYTVTSTNNEQNRVTYNGGLQESRKVKQTRRGPGGFGPFGGFGRGPSIPSPFSKPTFAGKTQTTNEITMTPRGKTLAMEGDSQLPYLLGNVSLLPFETLPEGSQREWSTDSGVSITQESENSRGRFGPFDPFGGNDRDSVQAAGELNTYAMETSSGPLVKVKRTYQLTMPKTDGNAAYSMKGSGTWAFDTKDHVPHSTEMKYKLEIAQGNSTTTYPIEVRFTRLSADKLAEMAAAAKAAADEKAQAAAVAKAAAEAPLTSEEKQAALAALASGNADAIKKQLAELAGKTLESPHVEVANAVEAHISSSNADIAKAADGALVKWSPQHALKKSLAKAYQGPGVLKSTGRAVESVTPLYVGQLVQAQQPRYGDFWRAAKVEELLPDGTVKLGFLTWGKVQASAVVARRAIQLAPDELPQAAKPKTSVTASTSPSGARTWSDATGRFKLEAIYVTSGNGNVSIKRTSDNRVISIPIAKLSPADQAFIKSMEQAENPFAVDNPFAVP